MGAEAKCKATYRGKTTSGTALLETDALQFRSHDLKLSVPFKDMKRVTAKNGALSVAFCGSSLSLTLGMAAPKWAEKIRHPPSRLHKLGVKAGQHIAIVNFLDEDFGRELEQAGAIVIRGRLSGRVDAVFCGASTGRDLARIGSLKGSLQPAGSLWVIRPKGRPEIPERAVMTAGRAAGLVDVKVVSFSATHTAEKFVIPVKDR